MPPRRWKKFFGDFRGGEMAAGMQATVISDDLENERAYLTMEARCPAAENRVSQKRH